MQGIRPGFLKLAFAASIAVTPAKAEPMKTFFSGVVTGDDPHLIQAVGSPLTLLLIELTELTRQ